MATVRFQIRVFDARGGFAVQQWDVQVAGVNSPPVILPIANLSLTEGDLLELPVGAVMALVGAPMVAGVAFAAGNKHQAEAVEHAKEAVAHGKQGHADALVKHAEAALKHAEGAAAETKNPHVTEAIKGLKDGIEHGKAGHAEPREHGTDHQHAGGPRRHRRSVQFDQARRKRRRPAGQWGRPIAGRPRRRAAPAARGRP